MRAIVNKFGPPLESIQLENNAPEPLSPHQLQLKMQYSAINPSDLITISGAYRSRIQLPFIPGFEGMGIINNCYNTKSPFSIGDRVLPIGSAGSWQTYRNIDEKWCFSIPDYLSDEQAATSYINPMTAWLMLTEQLNIKKGMSLVINGATSAIGLMIIRMLNHLGVIPIALVRRDDTETLFENCQLSAVINTQDSTAYQQFQSLKEHGGVDAILDCIGGDQALEQAMLLKKSGQFINYGLLSGVPISARFWQERPDIDFSYFHLRQWVHSASKKDIQHKLNEVMTLVYEGIAETKIDKIVPIASLHSAIEEIQNRTVNNNGKILISF